MPRQDGSFVRIDDFPGMVNAADPNDLPPGAAQVQVNLSSAKQGELRVRSGYLPVSFEASTTEDV